MTQTRRRRKNQFQVSRKWKVFGTLVLAGFLIALLATGPVSFTLYRLISIVENQYQEWFTMQDAANPFVLLPLSFIGGLIASISPCILAMLPINLSYIGTRNITSRHDALRKAGLFVLGNIFILSLFGLASSFAGIVLVEYRGFVNIAVGIIILMMGSSLLGLIKVHLPQINIGNSAVGPFGVGLTFALVSSPCSSPVLFAVLAAAAASGSQPLAVLTMTSYALGYTIIIFLASLLTGFAKQTKFLLQYSEEITKFGSIALILAGLYYLITGASWFLG
ncbi:MAG: cytochrome c biogenesis protein CcdA [Cyanobacteria bacterium]|nr:cytochrome c biogenesis protein CcdA [Cyanobacteria bacterium bin.51]